MSSGSPGGCVDQACAESVPNESALGFPYSRFTPNAPTCAPVSNTPQASPWAGPWNRPSMRSAAACHGRSGYGGRKLSPVRPYGEFLDTTIAGHTVISKPFLLWVNDGLMAVFFFLADRRLFTGKNFLPQPTGMRCRRLPLYRRIYAVRLGSVHLLPVR